MFKNRHRIFVALVAWASLTATLAPAAHAQSCDEAANQWLSENVRKTPTTYNEISEIPLVYRRAAFRNLSAATQSSMWSTQLRRFLASNPGMSASQKALVHEAIQLVRSDIHEMAGQIPSSLDRQLESLRERAIEAFGEKTARQLLGELGPVDVDIVAFTPGRPDQKNVEGIAEIGEINCSCSVASSYCGSSYTCEYAACAEASGCGTLWAYTCDGFCQHR